MKLFLSLTTPSGHSMGVAYSCLQKALRRGEVNTCLYWACQIGYEYPNALLKRLCQNSLEDAGSYAFALEIVNLSRDKPILKTILPYVKRLALMKKTHSCNWISRVALDLLEMNKITGFGLPKNDHDEMTYTARCLIAHIRKDTDNLRKCFGKDGRDVMRVYNFTNKDVLAFNCYHMAKRRMELKQSIYPLPKINGTVQEIMALKLSVQDYCYDKHTLKGKRLGRDYEHFLRHLVFNNRIYPQIYEPYEKEAKWMYLNKEHSKKVMETLSQRYEAIPPPPLKENKPNRLIMMMVEGANS